MCEEIRQYDIITKEDLRFLLEAAYAKYIQYFTEQQKFVERIKKYNFKTPYCIALCQGAAMHYHDKQNGVKDFDVWFFLELNDKPYLSYDRVRKETIMKFGTFKEKRIDLLFRSIYVNKELSIVENMQRYLKNQRTISSKKLAEKAFVILSPNDHLEN